jgi:hypothetical protein
LINLRIDFDPPLGEQRASWDRLAQAGIFEGLGALAPEAAVIVLNALKSAAPRRTGHFASTIRYRQTVSGDSILMEFLGENPLASWILDGTKPHAIEPKNAGGVLRFLAASGDVVFTRHVDHPGTKPNPFDALAWSNSRAEVTAVLQRLGRQIAEQMR